MPPLLALAIGCGLTLTGWLIVRAEAGAALRAPLSLALDALIPITGFVIAALWTQRPVFSGGLTLALCCGFAFVDSCKKKAFGEPVLLADFYSTADVVRHPEICLIFPRPMELGIAVAVTIGTVGGLFALEPATLRMPLWASAGFTALTVFVIWLLAKPLKKAVLKPLRRLNLTARPRSDARKVGAFAMLLAHTLLARGERRELQAAATPKMNSIRRKEGQTPVSPVLLIQSESFFDPRRLHKGVATDLLSAYDSCRAEAVQWGAFGVPAWGANTERTEFSVLTGLAPKSIGFDRFNPYRRFARTTIDSLAWKLRTEGYRTICIHPFDPTFYGRDQVFPQLGFEVFLGQEAFSTDGRSGGYIGDVELAHLIADLLRKSGPKTFIFAITMENHAPWSGPRRYQRDFAPGLPPLKDATTLRNYLAGVANADAMIDILSRELAARGDDGLLGFYGDHLPSLSAVYSGLDFRSRRSDYFLWRANGGPGLRKDIRAHDLASELFHARWEPSTASLPSRGAPVTPSPAVTTATLGQAQVQA